MAYVDASNLTVAAKATVGISGDVITAAAIDASAYVDSYLKRRFDLPIPPDNVGADIRRAAAAIMTYYVMTNRGFNPEAADSEQIRLGYLDAVAWLRDVSAGKASPMLLNSGDAAGSGSDAEGGPVPREKPFVVSCEADEFYLRRFWTKGGFVRGGVGPPRRRGW